MAALINGLKVTQRTRTAGALLLQQASRNLAAWNKDYKPAPFPESPKEKEAAAKKYHLLPEEYRPYANDGLGFGDYPKLSGGLGIENKDSYYPYDFPEHKRNLHETLNADIDLYGEDRYSQPDYPRFKSTQYWASFLGVMAGCFALFYWLEDKRMYRPVAAKQYPNDGKVHYTFEKA